MHFACFVFLSRDIFFNIELSKVTVLKASVRWSP